LRPLPVLAEAVAQTPVLYVSRDRRVIDGYL